MNKLHSFVILFIRLQIALKMFFHIFKQLRLGQTDMTANQTKKNGIMPCGFAYSNDPHFNRKRFTEQKRPPRSIPSHNVCDSTHIMTRSFNNKVQVSWDPQDLTDFELQKKVQH